MKGTDTYYVCERCGHYWMAPEFPDRCENCRAHGSFLIPCPDETTAEATNLLFQMTTAEDRSYDVDLAKEYR